MGTSERLTSVFPGRFESLDALRGLAALAVVIHHVAQVYVGGSAVMAFFVISGYCISAACVSARRHGLGFGGFMWRRVRRIMPPYLLSIGFWAVLRVAKGATGPGLLGKSWTDWIQNLTLTQWLTLMRSPAQYPPHNPTLFIGAYWSLCYEEQFYLVMGLLVAVAGLSAIASRWAVVALLVAGLAWNVLFSNLVSGLFIEYWAPFAFGCLVYYRLCELPRRRSSDATQRSRIAAWAIDVFLVAIGVASAAWLWRSGGFPAPLPNGDQIRTVPGELLVSAVFAFALILIRPLDAMIAGGAWFQPLKWLGQITFSLYLVHQFNLTVAKRATALVVGGARVESLMGQAIQIATLVTIGAVFWYFCERPFLNRPLAGKSQTPSAEK